MKRYVFMISDGTGITAETFGHSLITQFENIKFEKLTIPYIDSLKKRNTQWNRSTMHLRNRELGLWYL